MKRFALPFCAKKASTFKSILFIHSMFCWEKSAGISLRGARGDSFHHFSCHFCREVCLMTGECFVDRALVSTSSWSPDVSDTKLVKMEVLKSKNSMRSGWGRQLWHPIWYVVATACIEIGGKNNQAMMNTT